VGFCLALDQQPQSTTAWILQTACCWQMPIKKDTGEYKVRVSIFNVTPLRQAVLAFPFLTNVSLISRLHQDKTYPISYWPFAK